jgi:hypothetical protein
MPLSDFRAIYLPYCIRKLKDGSYIFLNREYKPLGFNTGDWIDYEEHPVSTRFTGINTKLASELSWENSGDVNEIYLYNDKTHPMNSKKYMDLYLAKIERLAKLKVKKTRPSKK